MNAHFARPWLSALALVAATASAQSTVPTAVPPATAHKVVDASFPCQQVTCDAEMWLPAQTPAGQKPPVILIAHGFGGLKDWGLPGFCRALRAGGLCRGALRLPGLRQERGAAAPRG